MNRFRALDIARGVAILGTLGTNIWIFTLSNNKSWLVTGSHLLTNGKFLGLLTLLFGIGMQLKFQSLQQKGLPWFRIYIWSMIILFIDGLLHFIFVFEFDVLMSYAFVGILASFILTYSKKVIYTCLLLASGVHFIYQVGVLPSLHFPEQLVDEEQWAMYEQLTDEELQIEFEKEEMSWDLANSSTYFEQVQDRIQHFWVLRSEAIMIIPMNLALFLVGALFVRSGMIGTDQQARMLQKRLVLFGLGVGIPLLLLSHFVPSLANYERYVFAPILAMGYLGLVFIWERTTQFIWLQKGLQNIGKMALSCYIGQNSIASILFTVGDSV